MKVRVTYKEELTEREVALVVSYAKCLCVGSTEDSDRSIVQQMLHRYGVMGIVKAKEWEEDNKRIEHLRKLTDK